MATSILLGLSALRLGRWPHRSPVLALVEYTATALRESLDQASMPGAAAIRFVGSREEILSRIEREPIRIAISQSGLTQARPADMLRAAGTALSSPDDGEAVLIRGCTISLSIPLYRFPRSPLIEAARLLGRLRSTGNNQSCWTLSVDYQVYDQQLELLVDTRDVMMRPLWQPTGEALRLLNQPMEGMQLPGGAVVTTVPPVVSVPASTPAPAPRRPDRAPPSEDVIATVP